LGAPASAQAFNTASSEAESDRSCLSFGPTPGSGFQGGIDRVEVTFTMSEERFRACSYVSSPNGATWPFRWQLWQRFWRIGATSFVKVGAVAGAEADFTVLIGFGLDLSGSLPVDSGPFRNPRSVTIQVEAASLLDRRTRGAPAAMATGRSRQSFMPLRSLKGKSTRPKP
jgi:hypothetical protein